MAATACNLQRISSVYVNVNPRIYEYSLRFAVQSISTTKDRIATFY